MYDKYYKNTVLDWWDLIKDESNGDNVRNVFALLSSWICENDLDPCGYKKFSVTVTLNREFDNGTYHYGNAGYDVKITIDKRDYDFPFEIARNTIQDIIDYAPKSDT